MYRLILLSFLLLVTYVGVNAQMRTGTVISVRANLRETPSQEGEVKQEVPIGTEIKVLDSKGAWFVVRIADAVGWMHGNAFRFEEGTNPQQIIAPAEVSRPKKVEPSAPLPAITPSSSGGYIRGPRGGCYYISGSGRKVYVDHSLCH